MTEPHVDLIATFFPKEGEADRVKHAVELAVEQVVHEPGCIRYEITEATPGQIVLTERWESQAALDVHSQAMPVKELNEALVGLLKQPIDHNFL
jgi:quinol monooxygenase YgiN